MREIKFKCWIRPLQKIANVHEIYTNNSVMTDEYKYALEADAVDMMQYTGLKDKNGVEIYEGDIINDDLIGICQVKYNDIYSAFRVVHKNNRDAKWFIDYLEFEFKYIKVIGNIYENPELLQEQNNG